MDEREIIKEHIQSLEESLAFLKDKENMQTWVVSEFLKSLNLNFKKEEIINIKEEPIDVIFRNANFQIKTIYDQDRKMHKEYKEKLERAKSATSYSEALQLFDYDFTDISIQEIGNIIEEKLKVYILSPEQYEKIDMLFYFNRLHHKITDSNNFTFSNELLWKRWRSVSMLKNGKINFIFCANDNAPDFIKLHTGKIIFKNRTLF